MSRRTLPALVVAVLAVAWPAAAQGVVPGEPAPEAKGDVPLDLMASFQSAAVATQLWLLENALGAFELSGASHGSCAPYRLTMPGPNTPVTDAFVLDPNGCIRAKVYDLLPPRDVEEMVDLEIHRADLFETRSP